MLRNGNLQRRKTVFILNKWLRRSLRHLVYNEYRSQSVRYLVLRMKMDSEENLQGK